MSILELISDWQRPYLMSFSPLYTIDPLYSNGCLLFSDYEDKDFRRNYIVLTFLKLMFSKRIQK